MVKSKLALILLISLSSAFQTPFLCPLVIPQSLHQFHIQLTLQTTIYYRLKSNSLEILHGAVLIVHIVINASTFKL